MKLLDRLFARPESSGEPYGAEVLCSNWVAQPLEPAATAHAAAAAERLREADAPTFLARVYASQCC